MILYALEALAGVWPAAAVLEALAVRAAGAAILSFVVALLLGPRLLAWLRGRQCLEVETNTDAPQLNAINAKKAPTPTMGGLMIIGAILVAGLIFGDLGNAYVRLGLLSTLGYGLIGFIDDWVKLTRRDRRGITPRAKAGLQVFVALSLAVATTQVFQGRPEAERLLRLYVPFSGGASLDLSWAAGLPHMLLVLLVVVGSSNAVNLTDGMDGLAAGTVAVAALAMAAMCVAVGRAQLIAPTKELVFVPGAEEMTVFCTAMAGATLGFLWFNAAPAQVYMGDTGSLPLGSLLGYTAVVVKQELALLLIGGVFVLEALSVILQVGWFKASGGRRILRCAPLHHHFQFAGVPETRITVRFWILSVLMAAAGLATLVVG
ncbi:MAG TPA: phospho-N-acetylmuramoyl-pentapeptide-transferase [Planctomycetota bacterium]|nr:phospho-N-acetylmuramoyl-pentapeptide-transferase [Planctomycetota bacterium]